MGVSDGLEVYQEPIELELLRMHKVKQVRAGVFSACLTEQNELILWGSGVFGTFAQPQKVCIDGVNFQDIQVSKGQTTEQDQGFLAASDHRGLVYTWGSNS